MRAGNSHRALFQSIRTYPIDSAHTRSKSAVITFFCPNCISGFSRHCEPHHNGATEVATVLRSRRVLPWLSRQGREVASIINERERKQRGIGCRRGACSMTKAEIKRLVDAVIASARKNGVREVEVKIGDEATVRIPLAPEKPIAEDEEVVL